ncbi:MAG: hypothetical protein AB1509_13795 [Chloroflexota bacterium]|nr:hypothetical protein [Chloroflexota bacterium]MBI5704204.1 hypothetical protein [Chloroflexota bacterium]
MTRVVVPLTLDEFSALEELSILEFRDRREQVRYILRAELVRRGLLDTHLANTIVEGEPADELQPA